MSNERREAYLAKIRDPRWQKRRLEIFQRDEWACQVCFDSENTLNVHHRWYENDREPWEASDDALVTLCEDCHAYETQNRKRYEAGILQAMRKRFFADALLDIWMMLDAMKLPYPPEVVFDSLTHYLLDFDRTKDICEWRLAIIRDQQRQGMEPTT